MTKSSDINRFKKFFLQLGPDDCWEWTSTKDQKGYGIFSLYSDSIRAHRASFLLFNGYLPKDKMVCHSCDNPSCVNPDHLWLGDNSLNMKDMWDKNRRIRSQKPKCHPTKRHAGHGLCYTCYKQSRRITRYCVICDIELPVKRAKICSDVCRHKRSMNLQQKRRTIVKETKNE